MGNSFVNNQTAGEYVASRKRASKMDRYATGDKAHATGMKKIVNDNRRATKNGGDKFASGGKAGATGIKTKK